METMDPDEICWGNEYEGHVPFYSRLECPQHNADKRDEEHRTYIQALGREELNRREARLWADAEMAAKNFRDAPMRSLFDAIREPIDEPEYSIENLLPYGGNALFSARYKSGKSTIVGQLAMAYADNGRFLDGFQVNGTDGNVCIWNYEVSQRQFESWLAKMPIQNPERILIFHARGMPHPLQSQKIRDRVVERLIQSNCGVWIVDPLSRALTIGSVNDDAVVGPFLEALEEIKERAGIRDLILVAHMGHGSKDGEKRALGSSSLSGWPDSLWMLNKDDQGDRYFQADGRDVDVPEALITYDPHTMTNIYTGTSADEVALSSVAEAVRACVRDLPGVAKTMVHQRVNVARKQVDDALLHLLAIGDITLTQGPGGKHSYTLTSMLASQPQQVEMDDEEEAG